MEKLKVQENQTIASSSLPSPQSSLSRNWIHDVFPSFHGPDVRRKILSHLLKECRRKGINQFIDYEIKRGESIGPELKRGIKGSKIAIVLLSKNYASSSWCLDELVEIMKCREKLGQTVISIFYEVEPTDVKKQTGNFGKAFLKTCAGKTYEVIEKWRQALANLATIAGYHSRNWESEAAMIEKITTDILKMLNQSIPSPSHDLDDFIGMRAHMENMMLLLRLDLEEVRMVGIWGPPGIGKSTIARVLFNQVSKNFHLSTIMVNSRVNYPRYSFNEDSAQLHLQSQMLSQMLHQEDIVIPHLGVAQEILKNKKVLLILDDVYRLAQLVALAKETQWFGPGSRIIITTQDVRVLKAHGINHIYKVDFPSTDEALQIFYMFAFGQNSPKDGFTELAHEVTCLAGNLPLGLMVTGRHLRRMSKNEWERELPRLRQWLDSEIKSILKLSYDMLCDEDKELFLHIACFFNHTEIEKVVEHLAESFLDVTQMLHLLAEKSLISINPGYIDMHIFLARFGKEIVRRHKIRDPGKRLFLVDALEICDVLTADVVGSRCVTGIDFNLSEIDDDLYIRERVFEGMSNLKFLRFYGDLIHLNNIYLPRGLNYLSPKLRLLHWEHFPMRCLPSNFDLKSLIELNMPYSKLEMLYNGTQPLKNLKWMDLRCSKDLKKLPDLSIATNLQELNLSFCSSLTEIPCSIRNLHKLQILSLKGCSKLKVLPMNINLKSLNELDLTDCPLLKKFPEISTNIKYLKLGGTAIEKVPSSIRYWSRLEKIDWGNVAPP